MLCRKCNIIMSISGTSYHKKRIEMIKDIKDMMSVQAVITGNIIVE